MSPSVCQNSTKLSVVFPPECCGSCGWISRYPNSCSHRFGCLSRVACVLPEKWYSMKIPWFLVVNVCSTFIFTRPSTAQSKTCCDPLRLLDPAGDPDLHQPKSSALTRGCLFLSATCSLTVGVRVKHCQAHWKETSS